MQEKYNESTPQRPEGERMLDAALVGIDLPAFISQIKEEPAWQDNDRNAITVFKTSGLTIVLIAMHAGAVMDRPAPGGVISMQVLEGRLQVLAGYQSAELKKNGMIALHAGVPHKITALHESVFLLTLASAGEDAY